MFKKADTEERRESDGHWVGREKCQLDKKLIRSISHVPPVPQHPPGLGHGAAGLGPIVTHGTHSGTEQPGRDLPFSPHRLESLCPTLPFSCLGGLQPKSMPDSIN